MISNEFNNKATEAVLYLKNGKRKYGMLMNKVVADAYCFISNSNYKTFKNTQDEKYFEMVSKSLIEAIDLHLK